ncbi:endothelial cell-specific chemotaxis regulator isoform X2 [Denticeps clupeoides]|uniref:endothelial cell-specific chemotaxis regulator isoform X2 n=1 Tax=Denticeps clupeoides TaxID=299321 RepID=UPI0010A351E1|nr:endothelial cell-specific chemotaxis regulator isoform X2 [Denticeps clupeoides]
MVGLHFTFQDKSKRCDSDMDILLMVLTVSVRGMLADSAEEFGNRTSAYSTSTSVEPTTANTETTSLQTTTFTSQSGHSNTAPTAATSPPDSSSSTSSTSFPEKSTDMKHLTPPASAAYRPTTLAGTMSVRSSSATPLSSVNTTVHQDPSPTSVQHHTPNDSFKATETPTRDPHSASVPPPTESTTSSLTMLAFGVMTFILILIIVMVILVTVINMRGRCNSTKEKDQKNGEPMTSESNIRANGDKESVTLVSMRTINTNTDTDSPQLSSVHSTLLDNEDQELSRDLLIPKFM